MGEERVGSAEEGGALLHELLLVLGIFVHGSRANAELLRWRCGERPTMLQRLVSLPFRYWCVPALRRVLLPTLLCGCLHDPTNTQILSASLHPAHLVRCRRRRSRRATRRAARRPPQSSSPTRRSCQSSTWTMRSRPGSRGRSGRAPSHSSLASPRRQAPRPAPRRRRARSTERTAHRPSVSRSRRPESRTPGTWGFWHSLQTYRV